MPWVRLVDNVRMPSLLLIAASRGLGLAMADEFLKKDWNVVATVRAGSNQTKLHALADQHPALSKCNPGHHRAAQIAALRQRLSGRAFQMLFVNAGTSNNPEETIGEVTTQEFVRVHGHERPESHAGR